MRLVWTDKFDRELSRLPRQVREVAMRKLELLQRDLSHPSLRVKRLKSNPRFHEGSINVQYRILFEMSGDTITLIRAGTHKILDEV